MIFTEDAFQAAAAFNADTAKKEIAGCVSWAPDIYNLSKVKGNRMLVTTQEANRLIADSGSPSPTSPVTMHRSSRGSSAESLTPWNA